MQKGTRRRWWFAVLIKGLIYGSVITAVALSNLGELVVCGKIDDPMTPRAFTPISLVFSFGFTFIIIFILQVSCRTGLPGPTSRSPNHRTNRTNSR